jgi:hypothetical protein
MTPPTIDLPRPMLNLLDRPARKTKQESLL